MTLGVSAGFCTLLFHPRFAARRVPLAVALLSAIGLLGADWFLSLVWEFFGQATLPWAATVALGCGVVVAWVPVASARPPVVAAKPQDAVTSGRWDGALAVAVTAGGVALGSRAGSVAAAVALILLLGVLLRRSGRRTQGTAQNVTTSARWTPPGWGVWHALAVVGPRLIVGTGLALGGLTAWSVVRAPLDPSPRGSLAVMLGGALGVLLPLPPRIRIPTALLAITWLVWSVRLTPAVPPVSADAILGLIGFVTGLALAAVGDARNSAVALIASGAVLPLALAQLPASTTLWASHPRATLLGDATRASALTQIRDDASTTTAHLGAAGGGVIYGRGDTFVASLDGIVVDPRTRTSAAERFAGLLGACATSGRARVRLGGDDLGLAALALRGQRFTSILSATPDRTLARAAADAAPGLARLWLSPAVQLVALPSSTVLRVGPNADVVVQIVRSSWSDARGNFPTRADLAAVQRTVHPEGVHVLALSTPLLPASAVTEALRAFASVWPRATLWLPPAGADTLILLGQASDRPLSWANFEACAAQDPALLRALDLDDATDIAGHLYAGPEALRGLPRGRPPPLGLPTRPPPGPPPVSQLELPAAPDHGVFDAGAPAEELDARHNTLVEFVRVLRASGAGAIPDAVAQTRALASAPGGDSAAVPLIRPQLDRVRSAITRGMKEGVSSSAWEEAETALTSARLLAPDYPETRCVEGLLAERRGQLPRAATAYDACVKGAPDNLDGLDGMARIRRARGDLVGTESALRQAYALRPDRWTTAHNLGVFLMSAGRYDEAERLLRIGAAAQARTSSPDPAPHLALAHLYLDTRRPALTLAEAGRAHGLLPSAESAFLEGAARYELGQYAEAERAFKDALTLNPDYYPARGGLGQVQAQAGEYAAAAESFKAVLARDPGNPSATENLNRLRAVTTEPNR